MNDEEKDLLKLPFVGYINGEIKIWALPESINKWSPRTLAYFAQHCGRYMYERKSPKLLVDIVTDMFNDKKFGEVEKMFLERIGHYCYLGYWESEKTRINRPSPKIELP